MMIENEVHRYVSSLIYNACLLSFYFHPVDLCTSISDSDSDFSPRMFKILFRTSSDVSLNFQFLSKFCKVTGYLN